MSRRTAVSKKVSIPHNWDVPAGIRSRLAEVPGTQRTVEADGQLLLILHGLPNPDDNTRELRLFWRDAHGTWKSDGLGQGINALQRHISEYNDHVLKLENDEHQATTAYDYHRIRREIAPIDRAAHNMAATLSRAFELCPQDAGLLACRNLATTVERTSELLKDDATFGLEYAMAKQAESQASASHRLNIIAAIFFPILAFASIFGMNLKHGLEHLYSPWLFWGFLVFGISLGFIVKSLILTNEKP